MITAELVFVPPGGGETDYSTFMQFAALPRIGDYISITQIAPAGEVLDPDKVGNEDFIVRQVWWIGEIPMPEGPDMSVGTSKVTIECEYAIGPFSSESHKKNAELHSKYRGKPTAKAFDASGY